jgi:hypothetical protein
MPAFKASALPPFALSTTTSRVTDGGSGIVAS